MSRKGLSKRSLLQEISIRNLGVIEHATVEFKPGLNVITGETGAGKTMLLTALNLILGGKADSDLVRIGHERSSTAGRFQLPNPLTETLSGMIEENDFEIEDGSLLLNRNVSKDGKSRAIAGGVNTTAGMLSEIAAQLIEIHGQHGSLVLTKPNKQREILDSFGGEQLQAQLAKYQTFLEEYSITKKQIKELSKAVADRDGLIAKLREIHGEFQRLKPKSTELADLDNLISKLESVEDLRISVTGSVAALNDEDSGALNGLHQSKRHLQGIKGKDSEIDQLSERIADSLLNLIDAAYDLERYLENLSADPNALESAMQRRAALVSFTKKFGRSADRYEAFQEAIQSATQAEKQISDLSGGDETIERLKIELSQTRDKLLQAARKLSETRQSLAQEFGKAVESELHELAMPKARLVVAVESKSGDDDSDFLPSGVDEVAINFSAHGASDLLPIAKSASGGELSRLMLGIEVVVANNYPLGTYIFDEVDSGVGGKAALDVGKRLKRLAKDAQVIVVTHLPQVAIWADHHILVQKNIDGAVTESTIRSLQENEREIEIARMLSGLQDSEHAQEHARELLNLPLSQKA